MLLLGDVQEVNRFNSEDDIRLSVAGPPFEVEDVSTWRVVLSAAACCSWAVVDAGGSLLV